VRVVIKCAVGDDLSVAVDGHGDAEYEAHKQRAGGLQAVEPFRHKNLRVNRGAVGIEDDLSCGCRRRHECGGW
jgi:hypothetical protein